MRVWLLIVVFLTLNLSSLSGGPVPSGVKQGLTQNTPITLLSPAPNSGELEEEQEQSESTATHPDANIPSDDRQEPVAVIDHGTYSPYRQTASSPCGPPPGLGYDGTPCYDESQGENAPKGGVTAPFKSGEIIVREFSTSKGTVEMAAETVINGKSLHLKDIAVYPRGATSFEIGTREVLALRNQLAEQARAMGFESLRITGKRLTGANPGKTVDVTIDLTKP